VDIFFVYSAKVRFTHNPRPTVTAAATTALITTDTNEDISLSDTHDEAPLSSNP